MKQFMSFALTPGKPIRRDLKRIVRKQLARASERLLQYHRDAEAVHESRKSIKKVEALTKLLDEIGSGPPRKDLERLQSARQTLSRLRDADVVIETFEHLRSRFPHRIPKP